MKKVRSHGKSEWISDGEVYPVIQDTTGGKKSVLIVVPVLKVIYELNRSCHDIYNLHLCNLVVLY